MKPVSIITIVKNGEKYLSEAINSVLSQSLNDFEYIIIDDGSTDNTRRIISSFNDDRIKPIFRESQYIDNLNYGISIAQGKYIARLDADDLMHTSRLKIQLKRMESCPTIDVCGTWAIFFETNKAFLPKKSHSGFKDIEMPIERLFDANFMVHSSSMIKKVFLIKHRIGYSNTYPLVEDYNLWFDIAFSGGRFYIEPQELTYIRSHEDQISNRNSEQMTESSLKLQYNYLRKHLLAKNNIYINDIIFHLDNYLNQRPTSLSPYINFLRSLNND